MPKALNLLKSIKGNPFSPRKTFHKRKAFYRFCSNKNQYLWQICKTSI